MRARIRWAALVALCSCEPLTHALSSSADGGHTRVPRTYLDARLSPGHEAHLALADDKQMACHDCHFIADAGFNRNAVKACAECHPTQQSHHHPFDGGMAMSCFSCHAFRSVGAQAGIDRWGCERCHVSDAGSAPQLEVHQAKCERCHRPHGEPFTAAADCGLCHELSVTHGRGEKSFIADTCMACHPHHTRAEVALNRCAQCHFTSQVPLKARVDPAALFAKGHVGCSSCHVAHRFTAQDVKPCTTCHQGQPVLAPQRHGECTQCHAPHQARSAAASCERCHNKTHVQHPKDEKGQTCMGCHPIHEPSLGAQNARPCLACHDQVPFNSQPVHGKGLECAACHTQPHGAKPKREGLCVKCHQEQIRLVQKSPGHADCAKCHQGLPHQSVAPAPPCLDCHAKRKPPQKGHSDCNSCHQSHSAKVTKGCGDCHLNQPTPLPGLHAVAKHQKCSSCHAPHTPEPGSGPSSCLTCHTALSKKAHPTAPAQCTGCHLFTSPTR